MRLPALPVPYARPRYAMEPRIGFYQLRLVRKGPLMPALIYRPCPFIQPGEGAGAPAPEEWCCPTERPRPLAAMIGNRPAAVDRVWTSGQTVDYATWRYRMDLLSWAHGSLMPEATPKTPVKLNNMSSLF